MSAGRPNDRSCRRGALQEGSRVPVRFDVAATVTSVRVFAGKKDVTARFARSGRTYRAQLPRALFKPGENRLLVQARTGKRGGCRDGSPNAPLPRGRPSEPRPDTTHPIRRPRSLRASPGSVKAAHRACHGGFLLAR